MAEPGGICISSSVYDQITGKLDLGFQDIGEQSLKNISRPIHVYRVSGAAAPLRPPPSSPPPVPPAVSAPRARSRLPWVIGAAVVAVIGAAVAWQGGWLRSGPADSASGPTAAAPAGSPPPAAAVASSAPPAVAAVDANAARAQAEADAQRLRADAEAIKRQAEAELARARSEADAGKAARTKADADAAAARLRAQAEADAARIRADAEFAAVRTRSDAETAARATAAQAPKPTPAQPEPAARAPVTPVVAALPAPDRSPPASPASVARFDGTWNVNVECPKHPDGAFGYVIGLVAEVKDGYLRGEKAAEGAAGEIRIEGLIQPDGTAKFEVKGSTGDEPKVLLKGVRTRTPYGYDVAARFEGSRGTGRRLQHRACVLTFTRQ
jgi:hypothetical protein